MTVIHADARTISTMQQHYTAYLKQTPPPHSVFSATLTGVTVTAYHSGKVLFQGANAEKEALKWSKTTIETQKTSDKKSALPKGFDSWSVIGSDEVGTGSYFGSLIVCAAYVDKEQIVQLKKLGVQDSKNLTDARIMTIAQELKRLLPHVILDVDPTKYNDIQPTMSQGQMKAECHNHALLRLLKQLHPVKPEGILIDQFELPKTYFNHIKHKEQQVTENVYFATKGESHHLAVASASIIARAAFLESLETLSQQIGVNLPSGAGSPVDTVAAHIIKTAGMDTLAKVAKLHFANTQKAQAIAKK